MTSRRQFLINGLRAAGAWLLAPRLARQIEHLAGEHGVPYLVEVDRPELVIYANDSIDGYQLTLGVPFEEDVPAVLTWREWADIKDVDPADTKAILECAADYGLYDPNSIGIFKLENEIPDETHGCIHRRGVHHARFRLRPGLSLLVRPRPWSAQTPSRSGVAGGTPVHGRPVSRQQ